MFTYVCDKPEKNIFQIYKYITGQNTIAQNILLCTKMTSNEEITAFLQHWEKLTQEERELCYGDKYIVKKNKIPKVGTDVAVPHNKLHQMILIYLVHYLILHYLLIPKHMDKHNSIIPYI